VSGMAHAVLTALVREGKTKSRPEDDKPIATHRRNGQGHAKTWLRNNARGGRTPRESEQRLKPSPEKNCLKRGALNLNRTRRKGGGKTGGPKGGITRPESLTQRLALECKKNRARRKIHGMRSSVRPRGALSRRGEHTRRRSYPSMGGARQWARKDLTALKDQRKVIRSRLTAY